jgi:NAD(P)H-quinone oxidoreductase subunit J
VLGFTPTLGQSGVATLWVQLPPFSCAYDVALGGLLVNVYHFTKVQDDTNQLEEVCIKVFVLRQNPKIPSIFWIWKSADF